MQITITHRGVLLAAVLIALGIGIGIGWAAIPSSSGVIRACLKNDGALKVIDIEAGDSCSATSHPS
jgi:hypothetical protein